jgi:hypothetical protein
MMPTLYGISDAVYAAAVPSPMQRRNAFLSFSSESARG